jgi:peptidoglycan glycosyltransferase
MRGRALNLTIAFIVLFVLLAAQAIRVQLVDRVNINAHSGNPRRSLTNELRGSVLDARGVPLAESKAGNRIYGSGAALSQLVGYSSAVYGESGLEAALDPILSPQTDAVADSANVWGLFRRGAGKGPQEGGDVVVTLRSDIAAVVDRALPKSIRGAAIVMDPRNGAILAAVNRPTFDPNQLAAQWKSLRSNAQSPLLDRALAGLYPPGSTFKMVTASAALDAGKVALTDSFSDPGYFDVRGFRIHNAENEITGTQKLTGAFALSSNVDFAQIGLKLGLDDYYEYLHRFHVGDEPGLAVPTAQDEVPAKATIVDSELAQMAFGQGGLAVTPLRMALVASTIANGGIMMRPQLVKEFRVSGGAPLKVPATSWERTLSATTAAKVRDMMIEVVRAGTGTAARLPRVIVAGKTGTATHPGAPPDAWFVCFAPADRPRLVVAVVIEDSGYGGVVSAPVARKILEGSLPLYAR